MLKVIKRFLLRNYIVITIVLTLFIIFGIYSFIKDLKQQSQLNNLFTEIENLETDNLYDKIYIELLKDFYGKSIGSFSLESPTLNLKFDNNDIRTKDTTYIMVIVGECGACFEREAPLWSILYDKLNNNSQILSINATSNYDITRRIEYNESIKIPIFNDNGTFKNLTGKYPFVEIITFVINSQQDIIDLHASFYNSPKRTQEFIEKISR